MIEPSALTHTTVDDMISMLQTHGVQPSPQRVSILAFMLSSDDHPTADEVHRAMQHIKPPISLATVYNTLNLFAGKGLLRRLDVVDTGHRFDAVCENHGHFLCTMCSRIFNFENPMCLDEIRLPVGFAVQYTALYLKGICPECRLNNP